MKKLLILLITILTIFSITGCDNPKQLVKNDTDNFVGTWYTFYDNCFDKITIEKDEKGNLWFDYKQKAIINSFSPLSAYLDDRERILDTREKEKIKKTEVPLTIEIHNGRTLTYDKKTNTLIRKRKSEPNRIFKPLNKLTEAEKIEWKNAEIKSLNDLYQERYGQKCEDQVDLTQIK